MWNLRAEDCAGLASYDEQSIELSRRVINARELGGYVSTEGRRIKYGKLIRTGQLSRADDDDLRILSERYKVGTVIDLRSDFELAGQEDPSVDGAEYHNLQVPEFDLTDGEKERLNAVNAEKERGKRVMMLVEEGMYADTEAYKRIMFGDQAEKAYRRFFELLLANDGEHSVLFHCTKGKDRTGIGAAMTMALLDFSEKMIMADYMMSNIANAHLILSDLDAVSVHTDDKSIADKVWSVNGVRSERLNTVFSIAEDECGSVKEFVKRRYGLSDKDILDLKNIYLE